MKIYIPTLYREEQITFKQLPPDIQDQVIFIISTGEDIQPGRNYVMIPSMGIGAVRQWALENAGEPFVMLDDDLVFARRRQDNGGLFMPATHDDIRAMFEDIRVFLDQHAHVGVGAREGGHRNEEIYIPNTRNLRVLGYNPRVIPRSLRFDRIPVMEDFDMALQLLEIGMGSMQINWIVHNQKSSNAPGGCSTYRTMEVQAEAARTLERLHPSFVKIVQKSTKTAWNGKERIDVRIAWKKAYARGCERPALLDDGARKDTYSQRSGGPQALVER